MLTSSKLKEFADDNLKSEENDRKFSKRNENTVGKGEIARYRKFFFSHSVLKRLVLLTGKDKGLFGSVNTIGNHCKALFRRYMKSSENKRQSKNVISVHKCSDFDCDLSQGVGSDQTCKEVQYELGVYAVSYHDNYFSCVK